MGIFLQANEYTGESQNRLWKLHLAMSCETDLPRRKPLGCHISHDDCLSLTAAYALARELNRRQQFI
jgi:hypothetical protein